MPSSRSRASTSTTASSLMQEVPGNWPSSETQEDSNPQSLSQALHARRSEYVRPKHLRIKIGTWNVASFKGTEKDVGGWFVEGKGVTEALAGLKVGDQSQSHGSQIPDQSGLDDREDVAAQEARYRRKSSTLPEHDPGSLPGDGDVGLYALGLQEVVDINSVTEALRPYTDPGVANRWKEEMSKSLPAGYVLVAEHQLIGLLLLVYASPKVAREVRSVSTTSVGTGLGGYMGNKGAVTARIVLGETTRVVFVNAHLGAGTNPGDLDRRNWDAGQITSRTRFEPINDAMGLAQTTGEQIGDEDFAFWVGDLNYRLEGIPGDDVRRLLMLHTRNEYDLSQRSAQKIEKELQNATDSVKQRVENRTSMASSDSSNSRDSLSTNATESSRNSLETTPTLVDQLAASDDPTSLQTTLSSLLPHDELHQQMKSRKAFYDGWQEGPINFLPTYKYDVGSVGVFDSSEKKRAPSWCDRILYRTRREKLAYEAKIKDEEMARKKDEEMKANGTDHANDDDEILYDYDPETDGGDDNAYDEYDEHLDAAEGVVITKEGFEDELQLEYYTAHQRVLSSDHKPLDAVFMLKYDSVVPELKAKVHTEVAKELDKAENESRPGVTVVVDKHRADDVEYTDDDPANFEGVWFGEARWGQAKHRSLTIANTGRVPASFTLIERPVGPGQSPGVAPKWLNLKIHGEVVHSSSRGTQPIVLEPGDTENIELELRIFDISIMQALNEGIRSLDDILVLRVEGGRDHFIPVRGKWLESSLGHSINKLIRIPEGGIRKLQNQRPDSGSGSNRSSKSLGSPLSRTTSSTSAPKISLEEQPVRFSAPRELFRLTEAAEELSGRIVAEYEMTATEDSPAPAWREHPGWPFEEACWAEKGTEQWNEALSEVCAALDEDKPLEANMPAEMPKLQRLYVLASFLLLFLSSMPDGVITETLWQPLDSYLASIASRKSKPSVEDQRTAIQELLAQDPSHSISFVLITSMLERMSQELMRGVDPTPMSPGAKKTGTFRRMAGLGKVTAQPAHEESGKAFAKIFASVIVRTTVVQGEKAKAVMERRKVELVEVFLRREAG